MARKGTFDKLLEPLAWFDENARPEGWFSDELLTEAAGGSYTLVAEGGTYSYSGNNANLTYTPVGGYTLAADGGTYSYSGNNANLRYNRILVADGGTYSYSGNNANLIYAPGGAYTLTAEGGVYSYNGNNADLVYSGQPAPQFFGYGGPPPEKEKPRKKRKREPIDAAAIIANADFEPSPAAPISVRPAANVIAELRRMENDASLSKAIRLAKRKQRLRLQALQEDEWLMAI
jgi:hypothetical protein